jgi:hypothetical protein
MTALYHIVMTSCLGEVKLKYFVATVATVIAAVGLSAPSMAQAAPAASGISGGVPMGNHMGQNNMTQDQFNKLSEYATESKRLTKDDKAKGKTLADLLAEDKLSAAALAKSMPLSCEVTDAMLVAEGPAEVGGKTVNTKTYEASCANGLGYFLTSADQAKPYGFSCFGADNTRNADIKAGRKPGVVCQLPTNTDIKTMAATVIGKSGPACKVRDYRWVGQNAANHVEFNEFACEDGKGYMMISALPGAMTSPIVQNCDQSALRGLTCALSDNGLLKALAQHRVTCDATDKTMHVIGQDAKKRYVVEFVCSQQPKGLVAYIPLEGNSASFETLDCIAAGKRGTKCTLNQAK